MNFFERQRQVRRLSWRLVLLFAVAVIGIVLVVDVVAVFAFGGFDQSPESLIGIVVVVSLATAAVIGAASLIKMLLLRGGGGARVAESLGGVPVPEDTTHPQLRRLRNVVEEIAIASGVPVPRIYVLPGEAGINAFAAGWSPADAAVAVTEGSLERLNRDELQGVIAHEFSHVVNGDMRLNIRLMGLLFGILVLAIVGRTLLYTGGVGRGRGSRGNNPLPLVGLALIVAGFVGVLVGRLIKAAVSRQREYLADASAVQFTRQTTGLAGALKKIAGLPAGSNLASPRTEDVSHMLFGSGKGFSGMLATHPPIVKRIQALDPSFDAAELDRLAARWAAAPPSGLREDAALGLAGPGDAGPAPTAAPTSRAADGASLPAATSSVPARPESVVDSVGESAQGQAGTILDQIPEQVLARARRADAVVPLVFGLLLAPQSEIREHQRSALAATHGAALADDAVREADALADLHPLLRLPLAQLAFPALRHRPPEQHQALMASVYALIQADSRISVSEYCLSRLLHQELYEAVHRGPPWGNRRYSLAASRDAAATLLAILAQAGHGDAATAEAAFRAGLARILPNQPIPYQPPAHGVVALEPVWPPLDGLNPADKQHLVESMVSVIGHDGTMTVAEIELLRTICALLHCPLPPLADAALAA
jgi:Zn-dependent protease with chaperone function